MVMKRIVEIKLLTRQSQSGNETHYLPELRCNGILQEMMDPRNFLNECLLYLLGKSKTYFYTTTMYQQVDNVQGFDKTQQDRHNLPIEHIFEGKPLFASAVEIVNSTTVRFTKSLLEGLQTTHLNMEALNVLLGPDCKLKANLSRDSIVLLLFVDKPHDAVTDEKTILKCLTILFEEIIDMDSAKIVSLRGIRLPMQLTGSFTMTCRLAADGTAQAEIFNDDMIQCGYVEGLRYDLE